MTFDEFEKCAKEYARKAKEKEDREYAEAQKKLRLKRYYGRYKNFIKEEDGHWIVVKNNEFVESCDTKAEAYARLHSTNYKDEDY